jgi:Na+/melibiose symporter-like transporter
MKTTVIHFLHGPYTKPGKWSIGLIVAMLLLFIVGTSFTNTLYRSVPAGGTILKDIAARPALALTMLTGMAAGVLAFVAGLVAIVGQKERSFWVFISTLIGALLLFFLAGEFISPG